MAAVTWIGVGEVAAHLGLEATDQADTDTLTRATGAANRYAYRRRAVAGYLNVAGDGPEDPTVSPGDDVSYGVILLAAAWYRRRGAPDGYPGWGELGAAQYVYPGGGLADISRLLGIGKALAI